MTDAVVMWIEANFSEQVSKVGQGSVVGQLLSLFFVNDFPHVIEALIVLFPHDVKMVIQRTQNMHLHGSLAAAWNWS